MRKTVLDGTQLRNLLSDRPVGASQVTAIVRAVTSVDPTCADYEVVLRVRLAQPYFVRLRNPVDVADCHSLAA